MTEISRRALIAGATATAATAAIGSILISPSPLIAQPSPAAPADDPKARFTALSAALTGIDANVLVPPVDTLHFMDAIFDRANNANNKPKTDPAILTKLLAKFKDATDAANAPGGEKDPVKKLLQDAAMKENKEEYEPMVFLMRSIILAWYLGAWYAPKDLKKKYDAAKDPQHSYYSSRRYSPEVLIPFEVISPAAYTNGMVWRVAQAHPMGYSNLQFGYWGKQPPEISMFTKPVPLPTTPVSAPDSQKAGSR